jgi:hypothetical protein
LKTFTLAEANALIPQLEELLREMIVLRDSLMTMGASLQPMLLRAGGNGGSKAGSEYVLTMQRFNACLSVFQDLGCELKDLDDGLVDFPSYRQGQLIYLCWKRGEDRIEWWHTMEAGFSGRQPL